MTFKHQVYPFMKSRSYKGSTDHVWISDGFLHREIHQFILSRISRRHGSFVPGPLEARRRAAKRRIMNLAEVGGRGGIGGNDSINHGFLSNYFPGQGLWGWQWQSPEVPPQKSVLSVKPSECFLFLPRAIC